MIHTAVDFPKEQSRSYTQHWLPHHAFHHVLPFLSHLSSTQICVFSVVLCLLATVFCSVCLALVSSVGRAVVSIYISYGCGMALALGFGFGFGSGMRHDMTWTGL